MIIISREYLDKQYKNKDMLYTLLLACPLRGQPIDD